MQIETDNRRARADGISEGLTDNEAQRFEDAKNQLKVHIAAMHGDRLSPLVTENLLAESILNMDVLEAVHGNPPLTEKAWRKIASSLAEQDPWVTRNLEFSDTKAKVEIRERVLAKLPGARRMAMQRSGELEAFINAAVQEELEIRCALRPV